MVKIFSSRCCNECWKVIVWPGFKAPPSTPLSSDSLSDIRFGHCSFCPNPAHEMIWSVNLMQSSESERIVGDSDRAFRGVVQLSSIMLDFWTVSDHTRLNFSSTKVHRSFYDRERFLRIISLIEGRCCYFAVSPPMISCRSKNILPKYIKRRINLSWLREVVLSRNNLMNDICIC